MVKCVIKMIHNDVASYYEYENIGILDLDVLDRIEVNGVKAEVRMKSSKIEDDELTITYTVSSSGVPQ